MRDSADPDLTSETLLEKLQSEGVDEAAWARFVGRYQPLLLKWCSGWGLQGADAEDITQNVLLELHAQLRQFRLQAGGRFRSWLKTVARRAWYDYTLKRKHREQGSGDSEVLQLLNSVEARDDFLQHFERIAEEEVLALAMKRVRQRVSESTWQAFCLMSFDGKSGAETAELLGLNAGSVFVANSKVKRLIHDTVQEIEGEPT